MQKTIIIWCQIGIFSKLDNVFFLFFCFFVFLGLHPQHMEVPRLGVESELQLPTYATAMAMQDLSHICDLPQFMAMPDP